MIGDPIYGELDPYYLRIAGATLAISAAVEYSLMDAAAAGRLRSATYQRLMLGTIAKSAAYLAVFATSAEAWTPALMALYPSAAVAALVINASVLTNINAQHGGSFPDLGMSLLPAGRDGWVYLGVSLMYLATAVLCVVPDAPSLFADAQVVGGFQDGPISLLLRHTWAPGFLLAGVAALNLRDAADRDRLGASTFKRLNLGLVGLECGYVACFLLAMVSRAAPADLMGVSNVAVSLGISSFCTWHWLWAQKSKK